MQRGPSWSPTLVTAGSSPCRPGPTRSAAASSGPGTPPHSPEVAARAVGPSATRPGWPSTSTATSMWRRPPLQRVQELRAGSRTAVTVAGTGSAGFNGDGLAGTASELDQPTGVAVDAAGDLFIADTANCRVRVLPAVTGTLFGQSVTAGHLFTVAGAGVCGSAGQGGPSRAAQLWDPVAITVDVAGDLLVADSGDQSVLMTPAHGGGTFYGTAIGAGDIGVVVGGTGGYGPVCCRRAPRQRADGRAQRSPWPGRWPDGRALRVRWLLACHPGRPLLDRHAARTDHEGRRPVHRRRRAPRFDQRGRQRRHPLDSDADGDAGGRGRLRHRGALLRRRRPRHGASDRIGSGVPMSRFGRRTFLASSAGVAGAAAAGAPLLVRVVARVRGRDAARRGAGRGGVPRWTDPGRGAHRQWVDGPGGDRPRRLLLRLDAPVTGARRGPGRLPRRGAAHRSDRGPGWSGTAARCPRPGRRSWPTAGRHSSADAAYQWTVQARGRAAWGPVAAPARFTTGLRDADWRAQWLRPAGESSQPDRVTYLRTELTPPAGAVARATAFVSAAHTYRLFVNGTPVDAWPSFSYPDEQYVRTVDLTGMVTGGDAAPSACCTAGTGLVRDARRPHPACSSSSPSGTTTDARPFSDRTAPGVSSRPNGYRRRSATATSVTSWSGWTGGPNRRAGRAPATTTSGGTAVTVLGPAGTAPFSRTYAQRTTIRETPVHPVRLHTVAGGAVVADFGAVYAARPRVAFARGEPGSTVTIRAGYLLDPDGQVSTLHGTQGTNLSSSYIMRAGSQAFEAFTYFGFRYLQIENAGQALGGNDIVALTRHAAMPDVPTATFSSDNRMLNAVWRLTARSCLYCCNEQFVDTPTREKGPFLWDASNESEGVMRAYGDQNMSWQALARRGAGAGPVLARRAGQCGLPQRRRRSHLRHVDGALPRVGLALLHLNGRPDDGRGAVPVGGAGGRLAVERPAGRHRAALRPGRHQ